MNRFRVTILSFLLLFCFQLPLESAEGYQRKSISYLNILLFTSEDIQIRDKEREHLLKSIQKAIMLERFDYNPLPELVIERLRSALNEQGWVQIDEIERLLNKTIGHELFRILDIKKEERAAELVTEVQRQQFIVLKAHELGLTAEQLNAIMNAAFVFVPVLREFELLKKDKEITCSLKGGGIWFRFEVGEDSLRFVKYKELTVSGTATVDKDEGRWEAFTTASFLLSSNLSVAVRSLKEFRLSTTITHVKGKWIDFPLGKREGLKLDQPLIVGEWYLNKDGKQIFKENGFVRVGKIADNRENRKALSRAWAIKKGYWVKGMSLVEHPRLPVDFAIRLKYYPLTVEKGSLFHESIVAFEFDNYNAGAIGFDGDLQLNLAPFIGKSQTFILAGGTAALTGIDYSAFNQKGNSLEKLSLGGFSLIGAHLGFSKKVYLGRFAFHPQFLLGFQQITLSSDIDDKSLSLINRMFGFSGVFGLEFALNVDVNIGLEIGYRNYPLGYWLLRYDDKEKSLEVPLGLFDFTPNKPQVYSAGTELSLYFHYSLPYLGEFFFLPGNLKWLKNLWEIEYE